MENAILIVITDSRGCVPVIDEQLLYVSLDGLSRWICKNVV